MTTIPGKTSGSNVDQCERYFVEMFIHPTNIKSLAESIVKLPEIEKTKAFRSLNALEIITIQDNLLQIIKKTFGVEKLYLTSSNNNKLGKDLYEYKLDKHIEIKLGKPTDGGLGMSHFDFIFYEGAAKLFPTTKDRQDWRNLYKNGEVAKVGSEFLEALTSACAALSGVFPAGEVIVHKNSIHTLNMFYAGINHLDKIKEYSDALDTVPEIFRFSISEKTKKWSRDVRPALTSDNRWVFEGAKILPAKGSVAGRPEIKFNNGTYQIRFTLNQKNRWDFKDPKIEKVGWGYGLNSLSLNMWIRKIPIPKTPRIPKAKKLL